MPHAYFFVQPIDGWSSAEGMAPWRSPERAPEYGGGGSKGRKGGGGGGGGDESSFVRSASFAGDPAKSRNTPWESDHTPGIARHYSLNDSFAGQQEEADVSWGASPKGEADGGVDKPKKGPGDVILESMLFKDDAKEIGVVEVRARVQRTGSLRL